MGIYVTIFLNWCFFTWRYRFHFNFVYFVDPAWTIFYVYAYVIFKCKVVDTSNRKRLRAPALQCLKCVDMIIIMNSNDFANFLRRIENKLKFLTRTDEFPSKQAELCKNMKTIKNFVPQHAKGKFLFSARSHPLMTSQTVLNWLTQRKCLRQKAHFVRELIL